MSKRDQLLEERRLCLLEIVNLENKLEEIDHALYQIEQEESLA